MTLSVIDMILTNCGMFFHDWLWLISFVAQLPVEYFKKERGRGNASKILTVTNKSNKY
jgi:hypothetical protein